MKKSKTAKNPGNTPARFKVGDQVRVRDMPYMFYTRSQIIRAVLWGRSPLSPTRTSSLRRKPSTRMGRSNNIILCGFVRRIFGRSILSTTIPYRLSALTVGSNLQAADEIKKRICAMNTAHILTEIRP